MPQGQKVSHWQIIAKASLGERIPRVPSAFHFALPFPADPDIDWSLYFDGIQPRAFLVSLYPAGHAKEGHIYPTDLGVAADVTNFLGVIIDGTNYEIDLNFTVTLAAGIPLRFLQASLAAPSEVVDPAIVANASTLGFKIFSQNVFWNKVQ